MKNLLYAQSGGATAVINASACGVIEAARRHPLEIGTVFAAHHGIVGVLQEDLIDTTFDSDADIGKLRHTPGCAFGSCRHKLKEGSEGEASYRRLVEVFRAHNIGYFIYNGGGDSQDTTHKISQMAAEFGYPVVCVGLPKTIDNDLAVTDNCPGFGSVAKYIATSTREVIFDLRSMASTSTKVFILEAMGRHTGWIAASAGLAAAQPGEPPQIILFPEIPFESEKFLAKVKQVVRQDGYCAIVVSEGIRDKKTNRFIAEGEARDHFGHAQLGGVAAVIARIIQQNLQYKLHWAVADYLQRAARHIASKTDVEQAYALGQHALEMALSGDNGMLPVIIRRSDAPYRWSIGKAKLAEVANVEKALPRNFISLDGYAITEQCRRYLKPLVLGEDYPPYTAEGLPDYVSLINKKTSKRLPGFVAC